MGELALRRLFALLVCAFVIGPRAFADDLVVDRFIGSLSADANSNIGENLKYAVFQWSESGESDPATRPLGGVRHFSAYLNGGSRLRLATETFRGNWYLIHQADGDTRGSSVIVWDGDAQSRGGNTRGLGRAAPDVSRFETLILDDLQVDIPPGAAGEVSILISLFDRGDATSTRMLVHTATFSKSRSRAPLAIPLRLFSLNDSKLGKFSGQVGALSLMIDGGDLSGVMVRFSGLRFEGAGYTAEEYVEEEATSTATPTRTATITPTVTPADQWQEIETETPDPFEQVESFDVKPTVPPTVPPPTPTPRPTETPRPSPTPLPTATAMPPTRTPTPFYGRCVVNFEGKIVCVKFPGRGKHECSINPDCNTPAPSATPTETGTPTATATPRLSCLCACRSLKAPNEYVCAHPWVFRATRFGYTCPDKELGNFPWSFELDAAAVPNDRSGNYCAERWQDKEALGYESSATQEPGIPCRLTECREGTLRRENFM